MKYIMMEKEFTFRYSEYDIYNNILPSAILSAFQDIAGEHAERLGIGYEPCLARDMIWILVRSRYIIHQQPRVDEVYTLRTWPEPKGTLDFNRDYIIEDKDENIIIEGMSKWAITNFKTRRLVRCRDIDFGLGEFCPDKVFEEDLHNFAPENLESLEPVMSHIVRFSDLDHNHHMNNTKYAIIALDAINLQEDEMITDFQINHLLECQKDEAIEVYHLNYGNTHRIIGTKNGKDNLVFDTFIEVSKI